MISQTQLAHLRGKTTVEEIRELQRIGINQLRLEFRAFDPMFNEMRESYWKLKTESLWRQNLRQESQSL